MKDIIKALFCSTLLLACATPKEKAVDTETQEGIVEITTAQRKAISIQIVDLKRENIVQEVKATGMIDVPPQSLVTVSAPMGGFVKFTEMLQGMYVRQGQLLATMEHPDYIQLQQEYLETKSELEFLKKEYERQRQLAHEKINSEKALQMAESKYKTFKARFDGLEAKLKFIKINPAKLTEGIQSTINIVSPITGYVADVLVNRGKFVQATDMMFKLIDPQHLHVELRVFEKDLPKIKKGQRIRVRISNEDKERTASVFLIGNEISTERTVRVHGHLDKEDDTLVPGLFLIAIIETGSHEAIVLPQQAIVSKSGKNYVFVPVGDTKFKLMEVQLGTCMGNKCEVQFSTSTPQHVVGDGSYELISLLDNTEE